MKPIALDRSFQTNVKRLKKIVEENRKEQGTKPAKPTKQDKSKNK